MSKTELNDRTLYFDGDSVVPPDRVIELFDRGATNVCVTELTADLIRYNKLMPPNKQVSIKTSCRPMDVGWNLPPPYNKLNVLSYVMDQWNHHKAINIYSHDEALLRENRIYDELTLYAELRLMPVLRAIIFIINTLRENNIVWGVGRGSSVSSYVLYLIGVHDVDSVKYDLDFTEFLRAPDTE